MGTKYSKEFKLEALQMAVRDGVAKTSEKLGIEKRLIYNWQRADRLLKEKVSKNLRPGESVEDANKRLEKECQELREANYILKKAMGFLVG